jgi:hypothetical protein
MVKKPPSSSYKSYSLLGPMDDSRQMCISSLVFFVRDEEVIASLLGLGAIDAPGAPSSMRASSACIDECAFFFIILFVRGIVDPTSFLFSPRNQGSGVLHQVRWL